MKVLRSDDGLVSKYVHDDTSETAIKHVSSCVTTVSPTGEVQHDDVERNKYSIFISNSAGCFMDCKFCYLTMKQMKYRKLSKEQILANLKEAVESEVTENPNIVNRYVKVCWMGMGDAIATPDLVFWVTLELITWILDNDYAIGLDGVDLSTVLPPVNDGWIKTFHNLDYALNQFKKNPNNNQVVSKDPSSIFPDRYTDRSNFRLFFSLHSGVQDTRDLLIPKAQNLGKSIRQLLKYSGNNRYNVIFHHMFIEGMNDNYEELREVVDLFSDKLKNHELRILRYNECSESDLRESVHFNKLVNLLAGVHKKIKIQVSVGTEISSACGQFLTPMYDMEKDNNGQPNL